MPRNFRELRRFTVTLWALLIFIVLVSVFWDEGLQVLRGTLFPVTESGRQALEVFAREMKQGLPLEEAISNLYGTILAENGLASLR